MRARLAASYRGQILEQLEARRLLSGVLYVDLNAPGPTHDGSSWISAYLNPQSALAAAVAGDQIRVADGEYVPGSAMSDTFQLKNGVDLIGSYAGYGASNPDTRDPAHAPSILRGPTVTGMPSYNIVTASAVDSTTLLDGFTIGPAVPLDTFGGATGLSCLESSPHIQDCTFTGLAGATACNQASPTFVDCTFSNNARTNGGAMYNVSSSPTVIGSTFIGNHCMTSYGGAIYSSDSDLQLTDCSFIRNYNNRSEGGAIYFRNGTGTVTNCGFYANSTMDGGGAIEAQGQLSVINCAFVGNRSAQGGAIDVGPSGGSVKIRRSTFTQNTSRFIGGAVAGNANSITGSIFWNDSEYEGGEIDVSGTNIIANDVQGGNGQVGSGNISADPLFVRAPSPGADSTWGTADDDYGNLQLQSYSPCIDAGFDDGPGLSSAKDLAGNPRVVDFPGVPGNDPPIDMGAYETPAAFIALAGSFDANAPEPSVRFTFNMDVDSNAIFGSTLMLTNLSTAETIDTSRFAAVGYDPATRTATWSVSPGALSDGNYRATLPGGSIKNSSHQPLSASFSIDFFMLAADANHDRKVDVTDLGILAANWQGSGKTFNQGDFNYDGKVDVTDLSILATNWQKRLAPVGSLAASIGSKRIASLRAIDLVQL